MRVKQESFVQGFSRSSGTKVFAALAAAFLVNSILRKSDSSTSGVDSGSHHRSLIAGGPSYSVTSSDGGAVLVTAAKPDESGLEDYHGYFNYIVPNYDAPRDGIGTGVRVDPDSGLLARLLAERRDFMDGMNSVFIVPRNLVLLPELEGSSYATFCVSSSRVDDVSGTILITQSRSGEIVGIDPATQTSNISIKQSRLFLHGIGQNGLSLDGIYGLKPANCASDIRLCF